MIGSVPPFPALEEWQKMSEAEQDALLGRMEGARRRNRWILHGVVCAAAGAVISAAAYIATAAAPF